MMGSPLGWREPLALAALILVPALLAFFVWAARRRSEALASFAAQALLPALVPDLDARRRRLRAAVLVGAVALLVVALAGPMWGFRWEEVHREGVDVIVAIDTSRSMLATDVKPTRLVRAKLAVRELLTEMHGDRIGLVAFAGSAFVQCPLTLDYGAMEQSLEALDVGIIPKGGTALGEAIDTSLEAFEGREGKHQAIILITDGEDHEGKVKEASTRASERGVRIFTVGLGTTDGELIPVESGGYVKDRAGQVVKSRLDDETLKQIAVDTGAVYLHATGASLALTDLYRDYIGAMEKRELASTLEKRFEQRFQVPLALALLLLVVEPMIRDPRALLRRRAASIVLPALLVAVSSIAWLDPHQRTREANRLFADGKYDEAAAKYNEALVDQPDSGLLHFNLGDAQYKQGKYDEALAAFQQVRPSDDDRAAAAHTAYNAGNATFRLGEALTATEPQKALERWAEALVAYRRAISADPADGDAKLNYELVLQKRAELQKKLEEQRQQQEQQQQDKQQQDQHGDDQQKPDQQPQDQKQADEGKQDEAAQDQQAGAPSPAPQPQASPGAPQPAPDAEAKAEPSPQPQPGAAGEPEPGGDDAASAAAGEKREGEMTRQEAAALLDAQRAQEVQPGEVVRRLQGAVVAEPAQDW